jgi:hypothetical protein
VEHRQRGRGVVTFTALQLAHFRSYVRVQQSNRYNMFDPRAAQAASLSRDEMLFVMEHYDALEVASKEQK